MGFGGKPLRDGRCQWTIAHVRQSREQSLGHSFCHGSRDATSTLNPILTDTLMHSGFATNVARAFGGHPGKPGDSGWHIQGTEANSVNRAYAEGRPETVRRSKIEWRYYGNWTSFY
jgi:hypothetical protein